MNSLHVVSDTILLYSIRSLVTVWHLFNSLLWIKSYFLCRFALSCDFLGRNFDANRGTYPAWNAVQLAHAPMWRAGLWRCILCGRRKCGNSESSHISYRNGTSVYFGNLKQVPYWNGFTFTHSTLNPLLLILILSSNICLQTCGKQLCLSVNLMRRLLLHKTVPYRYPYEREKNSSDNIGNRTCDLPACSAAPQPITPPHAGF